MENKNVDTQELTSTIVLTPEQLKRQWQGHRLLTRRVIEAFPEDKLFTFSVGGMRPFSDLALEMIGMAGPGMLGLVTNEWEEEHAGAKPTTKAELLNRWDEVTRQMEDLWPQIPEGRFQEMTLAFGKYEDKVYRIVLYFIDNEIHHRGQGYVYLRALGIEPPPFWDRP